MCKTRIDIEKQGKETTGIRIETRKVDKERKRIYRKWNRYE